jgi:hypothetical protein
MAGYKQASMLAAGLRILERRIQPRLVNVRAGANLRRILERSPAFFAIRRREVRLFNPGCTRRQIQERHGHRK